jgi:2-amino-4-hydroxy-6-hydroxymethyldihydropteridine diphosphokinase
LINFKSRKFMPQTSPIITAYIALGSNLSNPIQQIQQALQELATITSIQLIKSSSLYLSKPYGPIHNQPDFVNAVVEIATKLNAHELLLTLNTLEQQHQRQRERRWGPRTLDLDILLYSNQIIQTDALTIPHPEMHKRNFVVYPLAEIAPQLILPSGKTIQELMQSCPANGLEIINQSPS